MNKQQMGPAARRRPEDIFSDVSQEWIDVHGRTWDNNDEEGRAFTLSLGNQDPGIVR
jgi:hypothetical protein